MASVLVELQVPKEGKELVDFLDQVLGKALSKAPLAEYAELLVSVLPALDGIDELKAELKSEGKDELAAYLVHKLMARLLA
jgi:hypothetical protein